MKKNGYLGLFQKILPGLVFLAVAVFFQPEITNAADNNTNAATDLDRVKIGTTAPDFNLESAAKTRVKLSSYRNNKKVVLIFYRGYW